MSHLIATGRWNYIAIYLDDIVIFSHSLKDYKRHVAEILSILDAPHFKVSPPKCTIAVHKINFLVILLLRVFSDPIRTKHKLS